jgi:hypothetical protein
MQRNYTRRELEMKKVKEEARIAKIARKAESRKAKDAKITQNTTNASQGSSQPPLNNITQQSGQAQTQPTTEPHSVGISTLSTALAMSAVASRWTWTRFRSACCCMSIQNADGDH